MIIYDIYCLIYCIYHFFKWFNICPVKIILELNKNIYVLAYVFAWNDSLCEYLDSTNKTFSSIP